MGRGVERESCGWVERKGWTERGREIGQRKRVVAR